MAKESPQDVGLSIFDSDDYDRYEDDFVECGIEHPKLAGNECILVFGHKDLQHEDAAGNNWYGKP